MHAKARSLIVLMTLFAAHYSYCWKLSSIFARNPKNHYPLLTTEGIAVRELFVKPIAKDLVDHNVGSTALVSVGPFKLTTKELVQSIVECLINTTHAYSTGDDALAGAVLKASAIAELLYKTLGDIVRSTGWHKQIKQETRNIIEKFGGASCAKLLLIRGFYNVLDRF